MANIILPVNFSLEVRLALIEFMKQMMQRDANAHFTLLHAYDTTGYGSAIMHDISEKLEENAVKDLEFERQKIMEEIPNASIATYVGRGLLWYVVNCYELDHHADFMVVALKGSDMLQRILLSSKPSQLAGKSNIPMLFLPNVDNVKLPTKIAFGTDVKPFQNCDDFKRLLNIARILNAKLHFVYVNEEDVCKIDDFKVIYEEHLKDVDYDYTEVNHRNAAKGLAMFVKEQNLDGIGLIERKGNFLQRLFKENLLDEMVELAKLPIMVINEAREKE